MRLDPDTLEVIALMLEKRGGNSVYRKAWWVAAKHVRELRKQSDDYKKLNDTAEQIASSWNSKDDARASQPSR